MLVWCSLIAGVVLQVIGLVLLVAALLLLVAALGTWSGVPLQSRESSGAEQKEPRSRAGELRSRGSMQSSRAQKQSRRP